MKKIFVILLLLVSVNFVNAQITNPVKWSYTAKKLANKTYEIHITANIEGNWHVYAQDAGEGPEPTTITFSNNPLIKLDGKIEEIGKLEKMYDPNFKSTLKIYGKKVDFVQKIKTKASVATAIKGNISYMVCNDKQCLPPKDVPFSINISAK